ncbi:hypothetical protein HRI_002377800 [Hibiscus trionum]|uniref:PGG domain-containing protein n=1 Tax=Hibiscus trionum TaxID=183268 RepID=A0A9W7I3W9_HIBTR|nr:hypothetical protein HRI_002377800 [Hibiscus trionum]
MDQNLKAAAEAGNVTQLYEVIERDGNVLRRFDEVEFMETPLHIAAEKGCIGFAMEIMSLKPSLGKKLNYRGLSPMHLAVEQGQQEMALRLLEADKDLARVRGKNGETPLHYLCKVENQHRLLDRFMQTYPESIKDATVQNRTALHIAVENNRPNVLQVLLGSLRKKDYCQEEVNRQDEDGNTALHIAASNNQPQMLKLLLECKANQYITNQAGLTALDVAYQSNNRESSTILRRCFISGVSNFKYKLKKQIVKYVTKASSLIFHDMDNISGDDRNALLVILGLLLTASYQATLSPPGGLVQGDDSTNSIVRGERRLPGTSVMDRTKFLLFFIPTYSVFIVTYFLTLSLLKPFPPGFRTALQVLLSFLAMSFDQSISFIAPAGSVYTVINIFSGIIFILMVFMCITHKVSKLSVLIVGCCIFPSYFYRGQVPSFSVSFSVGELCLAVTQGLLFFLFLYDEFWKGTIVVLGFSFFLRIDDFVNPKHSYFFERMRYPILLVGCWLFLNACRFCIKRCIQSCNK